MEHALDNQPTRTKPHATKRTAPLLLCLLTFTALGLVVQFISGRGADVKPLALTEEILPTTVGEWHYTGSTEGWTLKAYPAGGVLYRYEREDGAVMLVTAGASQQRDVTFANVETVHSQSGHEIIAHKSVDVGPGYKGRVADTTVIFYNAAKDSPAFAFLGLFGNEKRLTSHVIEAKIAVTWNRALGAPEPWFACYFGRPMEEDDDRAVVAQEIADFAEAFMPTLDELRDTYAAS